MKYSVEDSVVSTVTILSFVRQRRVNNIQLNTTVYWRWNCRAYMQMAAHGLYHLQDYKLKVSTAKTEALDFDGDSSIRVNIMIRK